MTRATTTQPAVARPSHQLLPLACPKSMGFDPNRLAQLEQLIESHITQDRYPGTQVAIALPNTFGPGGAGSSFTGPTRTRVSTSPI